MLCGGYAVLKKAKEHHYFISFLVNAYLINRYNYL